MKKYVEKMKRFRNFNAQNKGGFTLVELIVVIAILAILAGIAVPAYSGYVEKARKAEDEQLLATVNTAFAAACATNGEDHYGRNDVSITLTGENGAKEVDVVTVTGIEGFDGYFDGFYEGGEFKVIEKLYYNTELGGFVEGTLYDSLSNLLSAEDKEALKNSVWGEMGIAELLVTVDSAAEDVAALLNDFPSLSALIGGQEGFVALAELYGQSVEEFGTSQEWSNLFSKKVAILQEDPAYADKTQEEIEDIAANQLFANNALLSVAKNTDFDSTQFVQKLKNGMGYSAIDQSDTKDTISQVSMAYALYAAYAANNDMEISTDVAVVKNTLQSEGFINYMNNTDGTGQAEKDLAGYQGAMNMISDSSSNLDAVTDLLVNGFGNTDLTNMLEDAIK